MATNTFKGIQEIKDYDFIIYKYIKFIKEITRKVSKRLDTTSKTLDGIKEQFISRSMNNISDYDLLFIKTCGRLFVSSKRIASYICVTNSTRFIKLQTNLKAVNEYFHNTSIINTELHDNISAIIDSNDFISWNELYIKLCYMISNHIREINVQDFKKITIDTQHLYPAIFPLEGIQQFERFLIFDLFEINDLEYISLIHHDVVIPYINLPHSYSYNRVVEEDTIQQEVIPFHERFHLLDSNDAWKCNICLETYEHIITFK